MQPDSLGRRQGILYVQGIPARRNADCDVPRTGQSFQLPREDLIESVIIADGGNARTKRPTSSLVCAVHQPRCHRCQTAGIATIGCLSMGTFENAWAHDDGFDLHNVRAKVSGGAMFLQ